MKSPRALQPIRPRRPEAASPRIVATRLGAALLLLGVLAGCGQKGPLFMPGEKPPTSSRSSS